VTLSHKNVAGALYIVCLLLFMYMVARKKLNICGLRRLSNWTVLETISLDRCSKGWSCWMLEHDVTTFHCSDRGYHQGFIQPPRRGEYSPPETNVLHPAGGPSTAWDSSKWKPSVSITHNWHINLLPKCTRLHQITPQVSKLSPG